MSIHFIAAHTARRGLIFGMMVGVSAFALTPFAAHAQDSTTTEVKSSSDADANDGVFGDITVVAQRREQKLQDVGISITAFSGAQLEATGIRSTIDLPQITPGLTVSFPNGQSTFSFGMRGVNQSDFSDHQESPIAVYLDDVYVSQMGAAAFSSLDGERVEILRGPQGTLFGRNATGGLINFITRRPSQTASGFVDASYGSRNEARLSGAIGGPLSDTLSVRISATGATSDGWWKNDLPSKHDGNAFRSWAARGQILFEPTSGVSNLVRFYHSNFKNLTPEWRSHAASTLGPFGLGILNPGGTDNGGYRNRNTSYGSVSSDLEGSYGTNITGADNELKIDIDSLDATLTSLSSYQKLDKTFLADVDASPNPLLHYTAGSDAEQFSQELRVNGKSGNLDWTLGGFYLYVNGDYSQHLNINGGGPVLKYQTRLNSYSVFAQGELAFTDQLTAIAGIRWTYDDRTFDFTSSANPFTNDVFAVGPAFPGTTFVFNRSTVGDLAEVKKGLWSGRFQLNYKPSDDVLVYASVNRGVKGPGFNAPLVPPSVQAMVFRPEKLTSYEVGVKSSFLDRAVRLNASVFYYDYKDYQAFQLLGVTQFISNRDARTKGGEIELTLQPAKGLEARFAATYVDAKVFDVTVSPGVVLDRRPSSTPEVTLNGLIRYQFPVGSNSVALQADARYQSSQYYDLANADVVRQSGYAIANARIEYIIENPDIRASLFVSNIANKHYTAWSYDITAFTGASTGSFGMPRRFGVSVRYGW